MYFFRKTAFTHTLTFQPCHLITPRQRWQIYLGLQQIWTRSEKSARASGRRPPPRLPVITALLSDSDELNSGEGRDYRRSFVRLAQVPMTASALCALPMHQPQCHLELGQARAVNCSTMHSLFQNPWPTNTLSQSCLPLTVRVIWWKLCLIQTTL